METARSTCVLFVTLLLLWTTLMSIPVDAQLVRGAGGEIGLNAYVQWGEGYNYVTDQILYTFNVIYNVSQGIEAYENDQLDFFAIDEPRAYDPNYVQVPLLAGGIALSYFLPTLATGTPALNLSREALAGIWLGQVTSWNDSQISDLNPNAALPNTPIILTYLPLRGVTKAFVRGLASFIEDSDPVIAAALRANETLAYLPPALNGNALPFNSTDLAMAYMFANPGTLMYVVNDGFYTPYLPAIAHLRNRALNFVAPSAASFQASLNDFSPKTSNESELIQYIVDGRGSGSYPLSVLSLLILKKDYASGSTCDGASLYMNELVWGLTNSKIGSDGESRGYTSLTSAWRTRAINQLGTINCDGARLLQSSLLTGTGPRAPFFSSYGFFYSQTVTGLSTQYFTGGDETELISGNVDYVGSVTGSNAVINTDLLYMPVSAFPISIGYYVPELKDKDPLIFDFDTLAKIYLGQISTWDDGAIVALNPGVALPSNSITVVLDESSGYSYPFTAALSRASPAFAAAIGTSANVTFPVAHPLMALATDVAGAVNYNPYSMAFAPQYIFAGYGASLGLSAAYPAFNSFSYTFANITEATLINAAGNKIRPAVSAVQAAMADVTLDQYLTADLSNNTGAEGWPISTFMYLVAPRNSDTDCARSTNLADLVWWILSSKQAVNLANINFVAPASDYVKGKVLDALVTMKCKGATVSSLAGCVYNGTVCSNQGVCSNAVCTCNATRTGAYCQDVVSSDGLSDGAIAGIVVGVVVPVLCLLLLLILAIVLVARRLRKQKKEDWIIDPSELELGETLGTGGFGEVRKAVWRGTEVAVKTINSGYSNELRNAFLEEVSVMTALRHPNVVLFMAASTKPPSLCIVMELMNLGSLHDVLHNELIPDIPFQLRIKILRHAAKGMYFLHSSGICHRDLKSLNLLLDAKWNVKVSDFGLTRFKEQMKKNQHHDMKAAGGSIHWTAPEVLNEAASIDYEAADMYSFGIILWEVHTRHDPYPEMSPAAIAVAVLRDNLRPEMPDKLPVDYASLMSDAWHTDPSVRPSFLEAMTRLDAMDEGHSSSAGHSWTTSSSAMSATGSHAPRSVSSRSTDDSIEATGHAVGAAAGTRAPVGEMAIVFSDIVRAMALWEFNASAMKDATLLHNDLLRTSLVQFEGYEVSFSKDGTSGEGSMCVTFQDPEKAVRWCMHVQAELLKVDWPVELFTHPAAAEEWGDVDDRTIYRGPRVRMGIHVGQPRKVVDPVTRRVEFVGPAINTAARITTLGQGGQVLLSNDVWEKLKHTDLAKERNRCSYLGKYEMPDSPQGAKLYELRPPGLEGRFFGGAARKYKDVPEGDDAEPTSMSDGDDDNDDQLVELPEGRAQEDSFLTSANLCRWIIDYKEIQMGKQVGMGSYGLVFRGRWKGIDVAVKRFIKQKLTERRLLEFRAEMAFLSELNHPNVVLFIGACVKRPNLCIVTEFVQQGSLRDMLTDRTIKLPWNQRLGMLRSAAMGVNFLHTLQAPVIHRDLKSSNLLVDENMNVKVADFGFARLKEENATMTRCGTPCWTAPEIIRGERYSEKADVYSFGVVMWEMLTRKQPFGNRNFMGVSLDVLEGKRPQVPVDCPDAFRKLMTRCWHAKPDKRPGMSEVVEFLSQLVGEDSLLSQT